MFAAIVAAKLAGIASLLILGWIVFRAVRPRPRAPEAEPGQGRRPDPTGDLLMRGFTLMLTIGVGSALAISVAEVAAAL